MGVPTAEQGEPQQFCILRRQISPNASIASQNQTYNRTARKLKNEMSKISANQPGVLGTQVAAVSHDANMIWTTLDYNCKL